MIQNITYHYLVHSKYNYYDEERHKIGTMIISNNLHMYLDSYLYTTATYTKYTFRSSPMLIYPIGSKYYFLISNFWTFRSDDEWTI